MKTKCYSVRLESMISITPKCYKASDFNGNEDLIPSSQVFGQDWDVQKSDAYWISAWILEKKNIQYSTKKSAWFDENGKQLPQITYHHHVPKKEKSINVQPPKDLMR